MYGEELCGEGGDRELESTTLSELLSVGRKGGRTAHGILNFFRHFFPPTHRRTICPPAEMDGGLESYFTPG